MERHGPILAYIFFGVCQPNTYRLWSQVQSMLLLSHRHRPTSHGVPNIGSMFGAICLPPNTRVVIAMVFFLYSLPVFFHVCMVNMNAASPKVGYITLQLELGLQWNKKSTSRTLCGYICYLRELQVVRRANVRESRTVWYVFVDKMGHFRVVAAGAIALNYVYLIWPPYTALLFIYIARQMWHLQQWPMTMYALRCIEKIYWPILRINYSKKTVQMIK